MKFEPLTPEFGAVVTGEESGLLALDTRAVAALLRSAGVIHLRGFRAGTREFAQFALQFGPEDGEHPIGHADGAGGPGLREVTIGSGHIELHGEGHAVPKKPDVLWFCCVRPAATGGETTVCDGERFLAALREETRALFRSQRLRYDAAVSLESCRSILGTEELPEVARRLREFVDEGADVRVSRRDDGLLAIAYLVPAVILSRYGRRPGFVNSILGPYRFRPVLEDGTAIPEDVIEELRAVGRELAVPVSWQAGEVLMIDNTRVMHGRRAFAGGPRQIFQRLTASLDPALA